MKKGTAEEVMIGRLLGDRYGVERQEAHGQALMVASGELPVEIARDETEDMYRRVGFEFGPVGDDELFRPAKFPEGWKVVPSDHSMHSTVIDGSGRPRVSVFYKAAFYDRRASMRLLPRYTNDFTIDGEDSVFTLTDNASGETLAVFRGEYEKVSDEAAAKLDEMFPDRRNPTAYWDDVAPEVG